MTIRSAIPSAVLSLSLVLAGCDIKVGEGGLSFDIAEGKATDQWIRSYTLPAGGSFQIINLNGRIDAFLATGTTVEVTARREFRSGSDEQAEEALKGTEIVEDVTSERVIIQTPVRVFGDREGPFQRRFLRVDYRVGVPPGLNVSLKTENGQVEVENLNGKVTLNSTNGGITAKGVSGSLDVQTVNGGINIDIPAMAGDVKVGGVNGGIRIRVRSNVDANLELHAVNGGVSVDDALPLTTTQRERQHVVGLLNKGGQTISAQFVNGGVRVAALN
jgi:hypothetical protein